MTWSTYATKNTADKDSRYKNVDSLFKSEPVHQGRLKVKNINAASK